MKLTMLKLKHIAIFLSLGASPFLLAQDSWSDSDPKVMTLVQGYCPLKVKGRSGEWGNFTNSLPPGRKVIGAVNPRRPDIVFFQLKRDSKFLFAGPRTCFEGEQNWNERIQNEVQGFKTPPESRRYFDVSASSWKYFGTHAEFGATTTESLILDYKAFSIGVDWSFKMKNPKWYGGLGFLIGMGKGGGTPELAESTVTIASKTGFHGIANGNVYYNWLNAPIAIGVELFGGGIRKAHTSNFIDATVSPSLAMIYGAGLGFIIRGEEWKLAPKVYFPSFSPSLFSFDLMLGFEF